MGWDWEGEIEESRRERRPHARRMRRGDTLVLEVQILGTQPAAVPPSAQPCPPIPYPTSIAGWKIWFTVKRTVVDPDSMAVCQLVGPGTSPQGSITIINAAIGQFQIVMAPIVTRGFPDGPVFLPYDIQVQDTLGNDFTVEEGTIEVVPDVTAAI